jgi:transposase-like protein
LAGWSVIGVSPQKSPKVPTSRESSQVDPANLNEKQLAGIELLVLGRSFSAIARELGVDRKTIFKWRHKPEFQAALRQRHHEVWGDAGDRLRSLVDPSIEVMAEHLEDRYDRSRFRAASFVLRLVKLPEDR